MDVERIYSQGWQASDLAKLRANMILVEPVKPPEYVGSIVLPSQVKDVSGPTAITYRVLKVAPELIDEPAVKFDAASALPVDVGDVVVLRNAMLEPIHPNLEALLLHRRHVLGVVG